MTSLFWCDSHESGVEPIELWHLLRRHGFVDGDYRVASPELVRRVDELAQDIGEEIHPALIQALNHSGNNIAWCEKCPESCDLFPPPGWLRTDKGYFCPSHGSAL